MAVRGQCAARRRRVRHCGALVARQRARLAARPFDGRLQHQAVHHGREHAHGVADRTRHAAARDFDAAENVAAADHDTKLDADQEWLFDFRATLENLGRIIVTPPNLPPARLAYLQAAVKKALTDPTLIAEGEKSQRYVDFVDAETTRKSTMKVVADVTPEQKERVKKIVTVKQ